MKLVVFGLSVSSAWGNGHATLWRGLIHALARMGHSVHFFEKDTSYYAAHRDCFGLPNGRLTIYTAFEDVVRAARDALREADVGMVTSYCPDAVRATELVLEHASLRTFYDLDTPITLARLRDDEAVAYLPPQGLNDFDLVLSYTGGRALSELSRQLGARRVRPLYGSVDPALHAPTPAIARYRTDLSYLGTYAAERQDALTRLLLAPARSSPQRLFAIGGSQYPDDFAWAPNVLYFHHVPPAEHASFYCSARLNLNITREPMAAMGYCPSGRLFEAAACGVPVLSDVWEGLDHFFAPGQEILLAESSADVLEALCLDPDELARIGRRARERTLDEHSVDRRAATLVAYLEEGSRQADGRMQT